MMKILYLTTIGPTMVFFKSFIKGLLEEGHIVDIACGDTEHVPQIYCDMGCRIYALSCSRSPLKKGNLKAISQIENLVRKERYDIVHCHTPIVSSCARLACRTLRKEGTYVLYTAHGFHFYDGAPMINWLIYYPIEKICAHWTDLLLTMNKEDYERAKSHMKAKKVQYVPGVGIDVNHFAKTEIEREKKREEASIPKEAFVLLSVGELNVNKNHQIVIKALHDIQEKQNIHYVIAGEGDQKEVLEELAKALGVNLHLLGYRSDVNELMKMSDVYILPSFREGLNVSIMEALSSGLPVICSKIRGNIDMVQDGENGFWMDPVDVSTVKECIERSMITELDKNLCIQSAKIFDYHVINNTMMDEYTKVMKQ